jgi:hypothetical protein
MIEVLPHDVLVQLLKFLLDDVTSIGRLATCHSSLQRSIMMQHQQSQEQQQEDDDIKPLQELWKQMYYWRWHHHNNNNHNNEIDEEDVGFVFCYFRREYQLRHLMDQRATMVLKDLTKELSIVLRIAAASASENSNTICISDEEQRHKSHTETVTTTAHHDNPNSNDGMDDLSSNVAINDAHIGRSWDHVHWNALLAYRMDIVDRLRVLARRQLLRIQRHHTHENLRIKSSQTTQQQEPQPPLSFETRLAGFLAARALQRLHLLHCLLQWKDLIFSASLTVTGTLHQSDGYSRNNNDENYNHPSTCSNEPGDECDHLHVDACLLEQFALLTCQLQQTPLELLVPEQLEEEPTNSIFHQGVYTENGTHNDVRQQVQRQLDALAEQCVSKIRTSAAVSLLDQIQCINTVLFDEYELRGNMEDYYNYRNSLLNHALRLKRGNPITLCILYVCLCRRLWAGAPLPQHARTTTTATTDKAIVFRAFLVGLPGHVVVGIQRYTTVQRASENAGSINHHSLTQHQSQQSGQEPSVIFLDAFEGGKLLSLQDCKDICHGYGVHWDSKYVEPMSASMVFHRILANLSNSHFRQQEQQQQELQQEPPTIPPEENDAQEEADQRALQPLCPFHQELWFQQRALLLLHAQPLAIVPLLLERLSQELPLTLSPDLLRLYDLLPQQAAASLASTVTMSLE